MDSNAAQLLAGAPEKAARPQPVTWRARGHHPASTTGID